MGLLFIVINLYDFNTAYKYVFDSNVLNQPEDIPDYHKEVK